MTTTRTREDIKEKPHPDQTEGRRPSKLVPQPRSAVELDCRGPLKEPPESHTGLPSSDSSPGGRSSYETSLENSEGFRPPG